MTKPIAPPLRALLQYFLFSPNICIARNSSSLALSLFFFHCVHLTIYYDILYGIEWAYVSLREEVMTSISGADGISSSNLIKFHFFFRKLLQNCFGSKMRRLISLCHAQKKHVIFFSSWNLIKSTCLDTLKHVHQKFRFGWSQGWILFVNQTLFECAHERPKAFARNFPCREFLVW